MLTDLWFFVGLSCLLAHEMDAVRAREWRLFVGLQRLSDARAFQVFTALHVPLYVALFVALFSFQAPTVTGWLVIVLDVFFIIHVLLHVAFRTHPHYGFHSRFSWALIGGCGSAGALDLALRMAS